MRPGLAVMCIGMVILPSLQLVDKASLFYTARAARANR
jgi:hypothetical protein